MLGGMFLGKSNSGSTGTGTTGSSGGTDIESLLNSVPELREALGLQTAQAKRQDPLHAALTQLALNFLPRAGFETNPQRASLIAGLPSYVSPYKVKTGGYQRPRSSDSTTEGTAIPRGSAIPRLPSTGGGGVDIPDPNDPAYRG
jgi:hypothetical protein